jgi:signal transduction histidine kinase
MSEKRRDSAGRVASALSLPDWSLRRKLALALTIPMLLAATFGGLRVHSALSESDSYSATASQVTVLRPAVGYLAAAERAIITSREKPALDDPGRVSAIDAVDVAGQRLETAAAAADLTSAQQKQLDTVLSLSAKLRDDQGYLSAGSAVSQVRQLQRGVSDLIDTIVAEQIEPEQRLQMLQQTIDGRVSLAMQQFQVVGNGAKDANPVDLAAEVGVEAATLDRLGAQLGTTEAHVLALSQQNAAHFGIVKGGGHDVGGPEAFEQYDELSTDLLNGIDDQLSGAASDARALAIANAVITAAALLAAIFLALFVSRLLLTPIRRVREGALEVANHQLPEMVAKIRAGDEPGEILTIPVTTHEEMGQLARAVDDLHRQAVHLASGEAQLRTQVAEMFSTLSRRNTSLINQQLGLIERLEKDEEDPKRLESLFRLDHLASRMRRTADSLMVLADAPMQTSDTDRLGLDDVFQAAMAGVQEYQRVQIESSSAQKINGAAAADVVHLMTELVDNALAFSPPTAPVKISTRHAGESTIVEISDGGLGIAPDVLFHLNADLNSGGEVTPETARRMGLLVVSRLAKRHGITVSLARNQRGGTTATVLLPEALLRGRPGLAVAPVADTPIERERPALAPKPAPSLTLAERLTNERIKRGVPEPVDDPTPAEPAAAAAAAPANGDSIEAAINAVIRLPQREPGATRSSGPMPGAPVGGTGGSLFQRLKNNEAAARPAAPAAPAAPEPPTEVEVPAAEAQPVAAEVETAPEVEAQTPEVVEVVEAPVADVPARMPALELALVRSAALRDAAEQQAGSTLDAVAAVEPPAESWMVQASSNGTAAAPPPQPTVYDSLDARSPMPQAIEADDEPPIFREMRSNWFSSTNSGGTWTTSEIEAGWEAAEQVAEAPSLQLSESGLPMRRPGKRLVPGGVAPAAANVTRDPEAIRARLAAHAAGVSRGRTAAVDDTETAQSIEEGPA